MTEVLEGMFKSPKNIKLALGGTLLSRNTGGEDLREINAAALAIDDGLANFVLLSRNEIEKFRSEIKQLKIEVEDLQEKILISAE